MEQQRRDLHSWNNEKLLIKYFFKNNELQDTNIKQQWILIPERWETKDRGPIHTQGYFFQSIYKQQFMRGIPDSNSVDSRNKIDRIHGRLCYRGERTFRIWRGEKQPIIQKQGAGPRSHSGPGTELTSTSQTEEYNLQGNRWSTERDPASLSSPAQTVLY